jgi:hypothetical protein
MTIGYAMKYDDWVKSMAKYPVLCKLNGNRVLSVGFTTGGVVSFQEGCDDYFQVDLTCDEVRSLAYELLDLVGDNK